MISIAFSLYSNWLPRCFSPTYNQTFSKSSESQNVIDPRWTRAFSYSGQFRTRYNCFGREDFFVCLGINPKLLPHASFVYLFMHQSPTGGKSPLLSKTLIKLAGWQI